VIALTSCPLTRPCAAAVAAAVAGRGRPVRAYAADGRGGRALEADVRAGRVGAVLDLSLAELAAELVGAAGGAGPDRLTAAALCGVRQVIALGALDAVRAGAGPAAGRRSAVFEGVTYLRTTPEENDRLGMEIAVKASAARAPTVVLVPLRGVSALDGPGLPFAWPAADEALVQSVRNWLGPQARLVEVDAHVNDPAFAEAVAAALADARA
jgi:uncharacterized protein (UPF0261 family)